MSVRVVLDAVAETLTTGNRTELRGFGSFALNYRKPRTGRNPKTGERVNLPAKYVPHFKAGKELRERVDASGEHSDCPRTAAIWQPAISPVSP